jgi:NAD(P)-dependent dehydrogenase (short-subunit alcohol dehydrogenase family)
MALLGPMQGVCVDLEGLRALIIGGTSRIGARTAELLAECRSQVVIAGRRQREGEELAARLGNRAGFVRCDVTVESDVARAVTYAVDRFGGLDALVNSAGGGVPEPRGIAAADLAATEATLRLHLVGVVAAMKHAAPATVAQGSGSMVNVASLGGVRAGWSALGYSAAKAALIHLTRCVAVELGEFGVRVNSVSQANEPETDLVTPAEAPRAGRREWIASPLSPCPACSTRWT